MAVRDSLITALTRQGDIVTRVAVIVVVIKGVEPCAGDIVKGVATAIRYVVVVAG